MKTLQLFLTVILVLFLFQSCTEDGDNIITNDSNVGSVTIKVTDLDNNPIPNSTVSIEGNKGSNWSLFSGQTDIDGIFSVQELISGVYRAVATTFKDGYEYTQYKQFQISADVKETVSLSPLSQKGDMTIIILDSLFQPFVGLNAALILRDFHHHIDEPSFDSLMAHTYFEGVTDSDGRIYIKDIPGSLSMRILCYKDKNNYEYSNNAIYPHPGLHKYSTVRISKIKQ